MFNGGIINGGAFTILYTETYNDTKTLIFYENTFIEN